MKICDYAGLSRLFPCRICQRERCLEDFGILNGNIMKKLKKCLMRAGNALTLVIFCSLAVHSAHASEPSYDGKPLSDWLLLSLKGDDAAREAILHIGTNGIPTLLKILSATDRNKKAVTAKLESKELKQGFKGQYADVDDLRSLAVSGFGVLGTNAEPAIPQLTRMLHDPETQFQAACVLTGTGPKGFAIITNAMNDPDLAGMIIVAINQHGGGDPKVVTQIYINALKSSNPIIRGNAADFLAGKDPAVAVPALVPMLDDSEYYPKARAAGALESYGPAARLAAPKLLSLYTNVVVGKDRKLAFDLGVSLLGALRAIDRDAARQAEAFLVNSGPLNFARSGYSRTLLPNGKELIAGGYIHTEIPTLINRDLSSAELVDPTTGQWTETGEMNTTRHSHTAILLHNGKVLVVGGSDSSALDSTSAELYDPNTGKWSKTGSLNHTHRSRQAVLQRDGKVRIPGGWDGYKNTDDELYDPATGTWTVITQK